MCKVYTGYHGTSEIEHALCTCMDDNPLAKARGLPLRTGAQTMLYLPHVFRKYVSQLKRNQERKQISIYASVPVLLALYSRTSMA